MAIDYEAIANAALVFVTGLILWVGGRKGLAGGKGSQQSGQGDQIKLDMAMMDNRAINALSASVEMLNQTVTETNRLISREVHDREIAEEVARQMKDRR